MLVALVATAVAGFMRSRQDAGPDDRWLSWVAIVFDIQVTLGLILYFVNQGWEQGAFMAWFHPLAMLVAVAVFHVGLARGRKAGGGDGWRTVAAMTVISLILVFAAIPWQR